MLSAPLAARSSPYPSIYKCDHDHISSDHLTRPTPGQHVATVLKIPKIVILNSDYLVIKTKHYKQTIHGQWQWSRHKKW